MTVTSTTAYAERTNTSELVTRITNRGQLFEGESVELECITSGSRPPAEIRWRLDGELLSDAYLFVSPDENSTTSAVSYTPRRGARREAADVRSFQPSPR
ncbi:hypothetical protein MRX96_035318 [Rhipicephalus microplus]